MESPHETNHYNSRGKLEKSWIFPSERSYLFLDGNDIVGIVGNFWLPG